MTAAAGTELPQEFLEMPATVGQLLSARQSSSDDAFVITARERLTLGEADRQSAALAGALLRKGVGKGSRVGILYPNGVDWIVTGLAAARIGALTVPPSTFAPGRELGRTIRTPMFGQLDSKTFDGSSHRRNEVRPPIQLADIAGNLRTSGIRYGNSSPQNEKELSGGTTNPYRCSLRVTAHDSGSPL